MVLLVYLLLIFWGLGLWLIFWLLLPFFVSLWLLQLLNFCCQQLYLVLVDVPYHKAICVKIQYSYSQMNNGYGETWRKKKKKLMYYYYQKQYCYNYFQWELFDFLLEKT